MLNLNRIAQNGADEMCLKYAKKCLEEFKEDLIGAEMGVAYGGGVEATAQLWKGRGKIYGFDTFTGHPKQLLKDPNSFEATCMDYWYNQFGTYFLSAESIQAQLDHEGFKNVILIKGLINKDSAKDIEKFHYVFIDLDIAISMAFAFDAVKDKIVKGGYILLHDVVPEGHIPNTHRWYREIALKDERFKLIEENPKAYTAVLQRI